MLAEKELLGGLTPEHFLREYWQKKPLLVRGAIPGFRGLIERAALLRMTDREDVTSRLVRQTANGWSLSHGPFRRRDFPSLQGGQPWTVLVQELNHHLPEADALLQQFAFLPHARLDDLMVSYAVPGGGVGPHFDSYDVFLLQGPGNRRWQISSQTDLELMPGLPLRILKHFQAEQEWVLAPGDMLYLPPSFAHHGIAEGGECMTYSIGFRAPTTQEIATQFLIYLQDRLDLPGIHTDPDLQPTEHPGEIPATMLTRLMDMIGQIRWDRQMMTDFIGRYLTEPKAHVYFEPPEPALPPGRFAAQLARSGIHLAPASRLLFQQDIFYLNGEPVSLQGQQALLTELADQRRLTPRRLKGTALDWLYDRYAEGFLVL